MKRFIKVFTTLSSYLDSHTQISDRRNSTCVPYVYMSQQLENYSGECELKVLTSSKKKLFKRPAFLRHFVWSFDHCKTTFCYDIIIFLKFEIHVFIISVYDGHLYRWSLLIIYIFLEIELRYIITIDAPQLLFSCDIFGNWWWCRMMERVYKFNINCS